MQNKNKPIYYVINSKENENKIEELLNIWCIELVNKQQQKTVFLVKSLTLFESEHTI